MTVVDCAFALEADEEISFDTMAPRRNGATLAVLAEADVVLAVGSCDPAGLERLIRGLAELADAVPAASPQVVLNRCRAVGGLDRRSRGRRTALRRRDGHRHDCRRTARRPIGRGGVGSRWRRPPRVRRLRSAVRNLATSLHAGARPRRSLTAIWMISAWTDLREHDPVSAPTECPRGLPGSVRQRTGADRRPWSVRQPGAMATPGRSTATWESRTARKRGFIEVLRDGIVHRIRARPAVGDPAGPVQHRVGYLVLPGRWAVQSGAVLSQLGDTPARR